jgi:hypothetical protein
VVLGLDLATVQLLLLAVELVLLVATVLLLVLNRRDMRSREVLMRHFTSVADVITRQEYFVAVIDAIQRAERKLIGSVTGSPPSTEESEVIQQILQSLAEAARRNVAIRYLLPLSQDRLQMGRMYTLSGASVRFNPSLLISDMRFMCTDDRLVLVGVPERKGKNEPTKKGYSIPSESVANLFTAEFEKLWNSPESKSYEEYLQELVAKARESNPRISVDLISSNLGIERADVEGALARMEGRS